MKKLLRKPINPLGFTLIELLVVVAIIAILSAVGITIFTNAQKGARDAQRKADINAIASAYEATYKGRDGTYRALSPSDFQSGKMPTPPENPTGAYRFIAGPNENPDAKSLYKVCADLEGAEGLYCRASAQGSATAAAAGSCSKFIVPTPTGGTRAGIPGDSQSCYANGTWVGGTNYSDTGVWIKCGDINGGIVQCTGGSCSLDPSTDANPDTSTGNMPFYLSETASDPVRYTEGANAGNIASTLTLYSRPNSGDTNPQDNVSDNSCTKQRVPNGRYYRTTVHLRN